MTTPHGSRTVSQARPVQNLHEPWYLLHRCYVPQGACLLLGILPNESIHFAMIPRIPCTFSIIVAHGTLTRCIGYKDGLPWPRLSKDLRRFAQLTKGQIVIMGRRTFDSREVGGKPLRDRINIVLSRSLNWEPPAGVVHAVTFEDALDKACDLRYVNANRIKDIFVVGGEQVYRAALSSVHPCVCTRIHTTQVEGEWQSDTHFPVLDHRWQPAPATQLQRVEKEIVEENGVRYRFIDYSYTDHNAVE